MPRKTDLTSAKTPLKHGSLFTGFGGWDIGAQAAGMTLAWGLEYDPEIAAVANANLGDHVQVGDILEADPASFERVDVLHASPPCPNFSVAKTDRGETERDIAMGRKVADFIRHHRPRIFTMENVYGYRHSDSWAIIRETLAELGYWTDMQNVNAANFGVPQTRRRMIVRAVLGGWVPHLPNPVPWVGWYAAIEDILDTLPPSQFAPWQMKRLPEEIRSFIAQVQGENSAGTLDEDAPAPTVTAAHAPAKYRAMLVDGQNAGREMYPKHPGEIGRVVAMTPRAIARFQTFPDWYDLPDKKRLATRGIGNAVPPLLAEKILAQLQESI